MRFVPQGEEQLRSFFREQHSKLVANGAGSNGGDPDDLHQLRVAVRRLRSILKSAQALVDQEWAEGLLGELTWVAGETGPARDLDVVVPVLRQQASTLEPEDRDALTPFFSKVEEARSAAALRATGAIRSERYRSLLSMLEAAPDRLPAADGSLEKVARKEFDRLRKAVEKLGDAPTDDAIHRVRIKGKRARYATELVAPRLGKPAKQLVSATKRFQDVAGEHHDAVVAEEQVRSFVRGLRGQRTLIAAGILVAAQRERRRVAADDLPAAWKRLEKAAAEVWS
jgi:CHAD domain-containing protein